MDPIPIFLEVGKKKTFAGALDWPGWARAGRDAAAAQAALLAYAPRYAAVLAETDLAFALPDAAELFTIAERHPGNATTDFGAPAALLAADVGRLTVDEFERSQIILRACWQVFDRAVEKAAGIELRKGPRGGGRDLAKMVDHVVEADCSYLPRLLVRYKRPAGSSQAETLIQVRAAVLTALAAVVDSELPAHGPRGGAVWPPRTFVRRVAWHTLDHAWEIEDRMA